MGAMIDWFVRGCGKDPKVDWRVCLLARISLVFALVVVVQRAFH